MVRKRVGHTARRLGQLARFAAPVARFHGLNALFQLAYVLEVLVDAAAVIRAELLLHRRHLAGDPVEDALIRLASQRAIGIVVAGAEQNVEGDARISDHGQWLGGTRPTDGVRVRTGIVVVASASLVEILDAELHRRNRRVAANPPGHQLVERRAHVEIGALRLLGMRLGEEHRARAKMIAADFWRDERFGHAHVGVAHNREVLSPWVERRERTRRIQFESAAHRGGRPQVFHRAPRVTSRRAVHRLNAHQSRLVRCRGRGGARAKPAERWHHRVEVRQRHGRTEALEEGAAGHCVAFQKVHCAIPAGVVVLLDGTE